MMRASGVQTVGARELKTRLGTYLSRVKQGEVMVVTERGTPIAELRPYRQPGETEEHATLRRLETEGLLRLGKHDGLTDFEPLEIPGGLSDLILEEREDRF